MTRPGELKLTRDGLRALAQRCDTLAGQLAASPAAVTAATDLRQSTGALPRDEVDAVVGARMGVVVEGVQYPYCERAVIADSTC